MKLLLPAFLINAQLKYIDDFFRDLNFNAYTEVCQLFAFPPIPF